MQSREMFVEDWCIRNLLKIGVPANLIGFKYLKTAVQLTAEDGTLMQSITKKLYPAVAKIYGSKETVVERGIRHAIDVAVSRRFTSGINQIFGFEVYDHYYKPSNSELISLLAEKLLLDTLDRNFEPSDSAVKKAIAGDDEAE